VKEINLDNPNPLVSIVVPAYNAEKFIAGTLDSLSKQILQDIEIIVVNDGSTDNTKKVIQHFFFDRRIRYVEQENGGTGAALNTGHRLARGKYVTWCSADNIYFPNFAAELVNALQQCEINNVPVKFVYSDFTYIDANGRRLRDVVHEKPQPRADLVNGYDLGMSFMYTKELWDKSGPFWNRICEDYDWAVRAAEHTEFGLVKAMLAAFRVHGNQITGNNKEEEQATAEACRQAAARMIENGRYGTIAASESAPFKPVLVE
jgi:glycosyltransferase involved in cell wall biosynthesis